MKNQSLEEQSITSAQETSQEEYDRQQGSQKWASTAKWARRNTRIYWMYESA